MPPTRFPVPPPRAQTIHNERIKLLANALNMLGGGLILTGVIAPLATFLTGSNPAFVMDDATGMVFELWTSLGLISLGGGNTS